MSLYPVLLLSVCVCVLAIALIAVIVTITHMRRWEGAVREAWKNNNERWVDYDVLDADMVPPPPTPRPVSESSAHLDTRTSRWLADFVIRLSATHSPGSVLRVRRHYDQGPTMGRGSAPDLPRGSKLISYLRTTAYVTREEPPIGAVFDAGQGRTVVAFRATMTRKEVAWDLKVGPQQYYITNQSGASDRRIKHMIKQYRRDRYTPHTVQHGHLVTVHRGFLAAYYSVLPQLVTALRGRKRSLVYFCGHSLGGAIAQLATAEHPQSRAVVFGSPIVGDRRFASLFSTDTHVSYTNGRAVLNDDNVFVDGEGSRLLRMENVCDLVVRLPHYVTPDVDTGGPPIEYDPAGRSFSFHAQCGGWRMNHSMKTYARVLDEVLAQTSVG